MPQDTPFIKSCGKGDISEVASFIVKVRNEPEKRDQLINAAGAGNRTPLHRAAGGNYGMIVQLLLDNGAIVDAADKVGRTPLLWACIGGHLEPCRLLLSSGADPNIATASGMSAMHAAVIGNHVNCVKALIWFGQEKGADINLSATDKAGKTPLELAKDKQFAAVANVLEFKLKHGTVKESDLNDAEAGTVA